MAQLVARRYARALFQLAVENNKVDEYFNDTTQVCHHFKTDAAFAKVMEHPQITSEEKMSILESVFKDNVCADLLGLLKVVFHKNREAEIVPILECFIDLANDYKNITTATISSAVALTDEQINAIKNKLSQNLNKQVMIETEVNPTLIGGLCIKVDGRIIDGTIKKQMDDMKQQLLNLKLA